MIKFIGLHSYPSEDFQLGFLVLTLVFQKLELCHPNKGCYFFSFNEMVFTMWVFYDVYDVKESIPIEPQVFNHSFDKVLGLVTFQLP